MQRSSNLLFASSNKKKYIEARKILDSFGIKIDFFKCELEETQSDSIKEIALKKARSAFNLCKKPVIIEDDGLFIKSLKGFPGPYSSYAFRTIGNNGILKLMKGKRIANFLSVIAYTDRRNECLLFSANLLGNIAKISKGNGWGYDPIFIPKGKTKTFAELDKNLISHRYMALKKFSNWYLGR